MSLPSLRSLYVSYLRSLYSSEHQLSKALPRLAQSVASQEVKTMIMDIQAQSEARCERLESASKLIEEPLTGDRCRVTEACVKQALELSESRGDERVLDLAVMAVLRQYGHFERGVYEIARSLADVLDEAESSQLMDTMVSETERMERALILLTEDMMDSAIHEPKTSIPAEGRPGVHGAFS